MGTKEIDHLLPALFKESAELAREQLPFMLNGCESPIEQLFLCAAWSRGVWPGRVELLYPTMSLETVSQCARTCAPASAVLAPQVQVGSHRVDFLFAAELSDGEPQCLVVVECDGHEFHEKTKAQAAADKARDRDLTSYGCKVFRFTGSEIWRDPGACADEVIGHIRGATGESYGRREQRIVKQFGSLDAYLEFLKHRH